MAANNYKKPTVFDIARRMGVSHTAVSLALRDSPRVGAVRRARIREIAREIGYYPRAAALALRSHRTGCLGILLEGAGEELLAESGFSSPLLYYFLGQCRARSLHEYVEFYQPSANGTFQPPRQLTGGVVDGMLVAGYVDAGLRPWLQGQDDRYPWVSLDEPGSLAVYSATDEGVCQAVKCLVELGHRRIAYYGGPKRFTTHRLGFVGFRRAVRRFGLVVEWEQWITGFEVGAPEHAARQQTQWAQEVLGQSPRPTAIVFHGAPSGRNILMAAVGQGLSVPRDLSLVGVALAIEAQRGPPFLSTIEADFGGMVGAALDLLLRRIEGKAPKKRVVRLMPRLVLRDTVAPAATGPTGGYSNRVR